ncbi:MAG: hypothetical protein EDR02_13055 [Actinobacteria bacterium]|nr:MAG: hypothetical protein EDR02_13055 [Actinomycetota bacterium]
MSLTVVATIAALVVPSAGAGPGTVSSGTVSSSGVSLADEPGDSDGARIVAIHQTYSLVQLFGLLNEWWEADPATGEVTKTPMDGACQWYGAYGSTGNGVSPPCVVPYQLIDEDTAIGAYVDVANEMSGWATLDQAGTIDVLFEEPYDDPPALMATPFRFVSPDLSAAATYVDGILSFTDINTGAELATFGPAQLGDAAPGNLEWLPDSSGVLVGGDGLYRIDVAAATITKLADATDPPVSGGVPWTVRTLLPQQNAVVVDSGPDHAVATYDYDGNLLAELPVEGGLGVYLEEGATMRWATDPAGSRLVIQREDWFGPSGLEIVDIETGDSTLIPTPAFCPCPQMGSMVYLTDLMYVEPDAPAGTATLTLSGSLSASLDGPVTGTVDVTKGWFGPSVSVDAQWGNGQKITAQVGCLFFCFGHIITSGPDGTFDVPLIFARGQGDDTAASFSGRWYILKRSPLKLVPYDIAFAVSEAS